MSWTATLLEAVDRDDFWKILVEFSDGSRTAVRPYKFNGTDIASLKSLVRREAAKFEKTDPVDLSPYVGQSVDITPPDPPAPPTQAELDKQAWIDDYQQLQSMLRVTEAVPALLTAQRQTLIDDLRTSLAADWNNSYLDSV